MGTGRGGYRAEDAAQGTRASVIKNCGWGPILNTHNGAAEHLGVCRLALNRSRTCGDGWEVLASHGAAWPLRRMTLPM